jgi:hypothetical protein
MKVFVTGLCIAIGSLGLVGLSEAQISSGSVGQKSASADLASEQNIAPPAPPKVQQDNQVADNCAAGIGDNSDQQKFSEKAGRWTGKATKKVVTGSEKVWDKTKDSTKNFFQGFNNEYQKPVAKDSAIKGSSSSTQTSAADDATAQDGNNK